MKKSLYRELDSIGRDDVRTYGKVPNRMTKSHSSVSLPTDIIFWCEETDDVFQLTSAGVSQFLRKCQYPTVQENVDWMLDALLNTPISESFLMDGYTLSISCKCAFDPKNRSLSELGIRKSMVSRPISEPPITGRVQKDMSVVPIGYGNHVGQTIMGKIPIGDGQGVLFGLEAPKVYKILKSQPNYAQQHDMANDGGLLADTNIVGFVKPKLSKTNMGWQE